MRNCFTALSDSASFIVNVRRIKNLLVNEQTMFPPIFPLRFSYRSMTRAQSPVAILVRIVACLLASATAAFSIGQTRYVEPAAAPNSFSIFENKVAATVLVDANDHAGVVRAAHDLQSDVNRVSGIVPALVHDAK